MGICPQGKSERTRSQEQPGPKQPQAAEGAARKIREKDMLCKMQALKANPAALQGHKRRTCLTATCSLRLIPTLANQQIFLLNESVP